MVKFNGILLAFLFIITCNAMSQDKGEEQGMEILEDLQLQEDKEAVESAYNTWWKDSQKELNKRMSWYSCAKFGCFIHWGVYSVPAGVWKGRRIGGYTEHLMRKAQIPLEEYIKELVLPFNPVKFDADEWMRTIRDAGMRYVVITAKHHDGFAMYFSDSYPYDMSMTKFNKDPMLELRNAARKYGIKFGFYYSHAFDWQHPNAPGNDWEYPDHPGGDKLVGGSDWWLRMPNYLPIVNKYVVEKSIPQVQELIQRYDPDLMWFDTPHKLPLYQNVRILEAIRELDKENKIVVNGRLARFADRNLGDYINTGDRAAHFYPMNGYWESIPTTNESYGYSMVDTIRKPLCYFVRLLASAVAKGGNILLNVGPKGDGSWDKKDTEICIGIGKWLKINGEAIYGAERTDLPIQPWGVTTQKVDTLYAHVFTLSKKRELIIGGLTSDIEKAWVVSDVQKKPIAFTRINNKDLQIQLPENITDNVNTVIALKIKKYRPAYPIRLLDDKSENILFVFDSERLGDGLRFGDGKINRNYITNWTKNSQWLKWQVRINNTSVFNAYLDYNTQSDKDSGNMLVEIGQKKIHLRYSAYPERLGTKSISLGKIKINKGEFICSLKGNNYTGNQYMNPIAIRFEDTK